MLGAPQADKKVVAFTEIQGIHDKLPAMVTALEQCQVRAVAAHKRLLRQRVCSLSLAVRIAL